MAILTLQDARIEINSVQLENWFTDLTLDVEANELDTTSLNNDGWSSVLGGLKSGTFRGQLMADFAASASDVSTWSLLGTVVTVKFRPTSGSISSTNPEYQCSALIRKLTPLGGSAGEVSMNDFEAVTSGAITRATS